MHKFILMLAAIWICAGSAPPAAGTADAVKALAAWSDTLDIDRRVIGELARFEHDGERLTDSYMEAFARDLRRAVFDIARDRVAHILAGDIAPFVEVTYPEPGFDRHDRPSPDANAVERFESGFVKTEALAFFATDKMSPEQVLQLYTSDEFYKETSSRVERLWSEDNLSCIETKGVKGLLDPTQACNRIDKLISPAMASEHSQVVANPGNGDYQLVYFKESLKTFVALPGGIALHYINYTRSVRLGAIKRTLGKGKVRESQERRIELLREKLQEDG